MIVHPEHLFMMTVVNFTAPLFPFYGTLAVFDHDSDDVVLKCCFIKNKKKKQNHDICLHVCAFVISSSFSVCVFLSVWMKLLFNREGAKLEERREGGGMERRIEALMNRLLWKKSVSAKEKRNEVIIFVLTCGLQNTHACTNTHNTIRISSTTATPRPIPPSPQTTLLCQAAVSLLFCRLDNNFFFSACHCQLCIFQSFQASSSLIYFLQSNHHTRHNLFPHSTHHYYNHLPRVTSLPHYCSTFSTPAHPSLEHSAL